MHCKRPKAKPLTHEEAQEMCNDVDLAELLVELNGKIYSDEDLHHCDNYVDCGFRTVDAYELDEYGLCKNCAESTKEWAEADRQMRSDYYASQL